jgi:hypothetical protein
MRTVIVGAACAAAFIAPTGVASAEGTMSGATAHASASVAMSDAFFDGPDCIDVPFDVTYAKTPTTAEDITLEVQVAASQAGSNEERTGSVYSGYFDAASATERGTVFVCPSSFDPTKGPITVEGTLTTEYYVNGSEQTVALQPNATMKWIRNQTDMSKVSVQKGYSYDKTSKKLSGRVVASTSSKGLIGADGEISLAVKKPGKKKWVSGAKAYVDEFGNWSTTVSGVPKGSRVRVTLTGCGWCTDASQVVKVRR